MLLESKILGHINVGDKIFHEIEPLSFDGTIIKYVSTVSSHLFIKKIPIGTKVFVKLHIVPIIHDIIK